MSKSLPSDLQRFRDALTEVQAELMNAETAVKKHSGLLLGAKPSAIVSVFQEVHQYLDNPNNLIDDKLKFAIRKLENNFKSFEDEMGQLKLENKELNNEIEQLKIIPKLQNAVHDAQAFIWDTISSEMQAFDLPHHMSNAIFLSCLENSETEVKETIAKLEKSKNKNVNKPAKAGFCKMLEADIQFWREVDDNMKNVKSLVETMKIDINKFVGVLKTNADRNRTTHLFYHAHRGFDFDAFAALDVPKDLPDDLSTNAEAAKDIIKSLRYKYAYEE